MKLAFVDTSCLAAIVLNERNAPSLSRKLGAFDRLAASPLLEAELRTVLHREGHRDEARVQPWLAPMLWVSPDRPLSAEIATVLAAGYVRGADCWHLATALYFSPDAADISFVTLDERQREVAKALGFRT
ncbi:MAG TPA: PIN domain-containing protein [Gemmatimonadaceae bacterium]